MALTAVTTPTPHFSLDEPQGDPVAGPNLRDKLVAGLFQWLQAGNGWLDSDRGRFVGRLVGHSFTGILICWLAWQVYGMGWREVWGYFPQSPMFYLLFAVVLCQLPLAKTLSYRLAWKFPYWQGLPEIYKSIVYNREFGAGAGEIYLYRWTHRELAVPAPNILRVIKDLSIVWWVCETIWIITLATVCGVLGVFPELSAAIPMVPVLVAVGLGIGLFLTALFSFHRAVFWLPPRKLLALGAICLGRYALLCVLFLAQWSYANPDVPLVVWLRVYVVMIAIQWLPGVPNPQVLVCSVCISLAGSLGLPPEQIAGILLVNTVLNKCASLVLIGGSGMYSFAKSQRMKSATRAASSWRSSSANPAFQSPITG